MAWGGGGGFGGFGDFGGTVGGSVGTASGTSGMSGASSAGASYGGSGFGTDSYGSGSSAGGSTGTVGGYGGAGNSYGGGSGGGGFSDFGGSPAGGMDYGGGDAWGGGNDYGGNDYGGWGSDWNGGFASGNTGQDAFNAALGGAFSASPAGYTAPTGFELDSLMFNPGLSLADYGMSVPSLGQGFASPNVTGFPEVAQVEPDFNTFAAPAPMGMPSFASMDVMGALPAAMAVASRGRDAFADQDEQTNIDFGVNSLAPAASFANFAGTPGAGMIDAANFPAAAPLDAVRGLVASDPEAFAISPDMALASYLGTMEARGPQNVADVVQSIANRAGQNHNNYGTTMSAQALQRGQYSPMDAALSRVTPDRAAQAKYGDLGLTRDQVMAAAAQPDWAGALSSVFGGRGNPATARSVANDFAQLGPLSASAAQTLAGRTDYRGYSRNADEISRGPVGPATGANSFRSANADMPAASYFAGNVRGGMPSLDSYATLTAPTPPSRPADIAAPGASNMIGFPGVDDAIAAFGQSGLPSAMDQDMTLGGIRGTLSADQDRARAAGSERAAAEFAAAMADRRSADTTIDALTGMSTPYASSIVDFAPVAAALSGMQAPAPERVDPAYGMSGANSLMTVEAQQAMQDALEAGMPNARAASMNQGYGNALQGVLGTIGTPSFDLAGAAAPRGFDPVTGAPVGMGAAIAGMPSIDPGVMAAINAMGAAQSAPAITDYSKTPAVSAAALEAALGAPLAEMASLPPAATAAPDLPPAIDVPTRALMEAVAASPRNPAELDQPLELNDQPYGTLWSDPRAGPSTGFHRSVMPHVVDGILGMIPGVGLVNTASKLGGYGTVGSWLGANSLPYNEAWEAADGEDNSFMYGRGGGSEGGNAPPPSPPPAPASIGALSGFRRRYLGAGDDLLRYGIAPDGEREYYEPVEMAEGGMVRSGRGALGAIYDAARSMFSPGGELNPTGPLIEPTAEGVMGAVDFAGEMITPGPGIEEGMRRMSSARDSYRDGDYLDAAGNAMTGVLEAGMDIPQLGIFAGAGARTANRVALDQAKELAESGADRRAIWDATGWFKGADGQWRFEIDDSGASASGKNWRASGSAEGAYRDIVDHPELGRAYPDVMGIDTRAEYSPVYSDVGGYTPYQNREHLGLFDLQEEIFAKGKGRSPESTTNTLLHEGQHAVQHREGFATGGNQSMARDLSAEPLMGDIQALQDYINNTRRAVNSAGEIGPFERGQLEMIADAEKELAQLQSRIAGKPATAFDAYRRLAGEVEARNVETRRDFTPDERRARPPWETQDVPDDLQIVRMGDR